MNKKLLYLTIPLLIAACDQQTETKTEEIATTDTTVQETSPPPAKPVVVQIGAFRKVKNAEKRASEIGGSVIEFENGLQKVFVTVENDDQVYQVKNMFNHVDQPFRRLDK